MFMGWLQHRPTPAFQRRFGQGMVLALDSTLYHHGLDPEIRAPKSKSNTRVVQSLLCQVYSRCDMEGTEGSRGTKNSGHLLVGVPMTEAGTGWASGSSPKSLELSLGLSIRREKGVGASLDFMDE